MPNPYDAIIIGTGAGGGPMALRLAQAGKRILILERGPFLPQEKLNWSTIAVFGQNRYHTRETWHDKNGKDLHPQQAYFVGGQTKVYGAAMFRMRARGFRSHSARRRHLARMAHHVQRPRTPSTAEAEELFHVHGDLGTSPTSRPRRLGVLSYDPTEPFHSKPVPLSQPSPTSPAWQSIEAWRSCKLRHQHLSHPARPQTQRRQTRSPRPASGAIPATAIPAPSMPSLTQTSTASGRFCTCPMSV